MNRNLLVIVGMIVCWSTPASSFDYASGDCVGGCEAGDDWIFTNPNELKTAISTIETAISGVTADEFDELQSLDAVDISAAAWSSLSVLSGTNTGDKDEVDGVLDANICQGNGSAADCDITTWAVIVGLLSDISLDVGEITQLSNIGDLVISGTNWTAVSNLTGINSGDNDEVGTVNNTEICQGDGSGNVQCDIANLSNLNTALGSTVADGGHTTEVNNLGVAVTWANVPDANVVGSAERDEVCGTTDLSATCEVNATHSGTAHHPIFTGAADPGADHSGFAGGDGIIETAGSIAVDLNATLDGVGLTSSLSGMEFTATGEVALLQGCADGQIPKWVDAGATWDCAADAGGAETNSLETVMIGVLTGEIPIGTTAGGVAEYVLLPTCDPDAKWEYLDGAPDTVICEQINGLIDADVSNTLTASIFVGSGSTTNAVDLATAEVAGVLDESNLDADIVLDNAASTFGAFAYNLEASTVTVNTEALTDNDNSVASTGFVHQIEYTKCVTLEAPTTADINVPWFAADGAITLVEAGCHLDAGTATIQIEDAGDILFDSPTCGTAATMGWESVTTSTVTTDEIIEFDVDAVSGVGWLQICIKYTSP